MRTESQGTYTVESDGSTVWVNGLLCCVARFGEKGFEYNDLLTCGGFKPQGGVTTEADWARFVRLARKVFDVGVGDQHKPTRFSTRPSGAS